MNNIHIIYEYDKLMSRLGDEIKNSNYKIQYFLDLLHIKRSFFLQKTKRKEIYFGRDD